MRVAHRMVKPCVPLDLVKDKTTFENVTIDNFANYPNPPAWGVGWYFDGVALPEIVMRRGTKCAR